MWPHPLPSNGGQELAGELYVVHSFDFWSAFYDDSLFMPPRCFTVLTALLHCFIVCLPLQIAGGHCMWSVPEKGGDTVYKGSEKGTCVCV